MVGAGRFELPTPCSRSKCATRLRYAPPDRQLEGTAPEHVLQRIVLGEGGFIALDNGTRKHTKGSAVAGFAETQMTCFPGNSWQSAAGP